MKRSRIVVALLAAILFASCGLLRADTPLKSILADVSVEQHLDAQVPLDLKFRDESGQPLKLGDCFGNKPVVLMLVYYKCPMLCTQVLNGFLKSSQAMQLVIGEDYDVVTVSFDPRETHELAAAKKAQYVKKYRRPGADQGWHFLTGDQAPVEKLAQTVGFRYHFDAASDQFAHASALIVLTPDGRISQYFYGIEYPPGDLRLALVESSAGRIGSPVDQFLLLCYHYDPTTGKYGLVISNVLRLAGSLTVLVLGGCIVHMVRQDRRRNRDAASKQPAGDDDRPEPLVHFEP